jgi:hypothetical protein
LNKSNFAHAHDLNHFRGLWGIHGRSHLLARLLDWSSMQARNQWPITRRGQRTVKRALTAFECFVKGDDLFFDPSNHGCDI